RAWDVSDDLEDIDHAEIVAEIADTLQIFSSNRPERARRLPLKALQRVRDEIAADPVHRRAVESLEDIAGLDRWTLARDFRAAYGTSPRTFRTMRQLDQVRGSVVRDTPLA